MPIFWLLLRKYDQQTTATGSMYYFHYFRTTLLDSVDFVKISWVILVMTKVTGSECGNCGLLASYNPVDCCIQTGPTFIECFQRTVLPTYSLAPCTKCKEYTSQSPVSVPTDRQHKYGIYKHTVYWHAYSCRQCLQ